MSRGYLATHDSSVITLRFTPLVPYRYPSDCSGQTSRDCQELPQLLL